MSARRIVGIRRIAIGVVSVTLLAFGLLPTGCEGTRAESGLTEPLRVKNAQFVEGALPGSQPGTAGRDDLRITQVTSSNRVALPGQAGKKLEGRAGNGASAIGIRFSDMGTGYWVFPLGAPDPQFPGELSWEAEFDVSLAASDAPGFHPVRVVAVDGAGVAGEQSEWSLCVASRLPDNLNACDPNVAPPDVVISLSWDTPMDLDLEATLPSGKTVDPKHPLSDPTADGGAASPDVATISRDSLAGCVDDGRRQEDLVWTKRPTGSVDLYVHLFDGCGKPAAGFTMVVYEADGQIPNRRLVERFRKNGRILNNFSETESESNSLFVASYDF